MGKRCPFFSRCCKRYAAQFSAVGAAFYTTVRVNAALCFSAVGVGVMLPIFAAVGAAVYTTARAIAARCFSAVGVGVVLLFTAVDAAFYITVRVNAGCFSAVGVGVVLPIFVLLVPPFKLRLG